MGEILENCSYLLSGTRIAVRVGACAAALASLVGEIKAHVFAAERIHADDATVKVLAKGKKNAVSDVVKITSDIVWRLVHGVGPRASLFVVFRVGGNEKKARRDHGICLVKCYCEAME
ncbi:MAG: transposase [Alphaproteobacteria bacterium]|nr:transposase [Alphaproteobacteria bacterium]MDE2495636.1 transposase [Alphaproteobacteria bacterium]